MWLHNALATCKALKYVQQLDKFVHIRSKHCQNTHATLRQKGTTDMYIRDGKSASV